MKKLTSKKIGAMLMGPVAAAMAMYGGKEDFAEETEEDQLTLGMVLFFLLFMVFTSVPLVIAIVIAVRCKEGVVNTLLAVFYPVCYLIARLIFPCN